MLVFRRRESSGHSGATGNWLSAYDGYAIARKLRLCMIIFNLSTASFIFSEKLLCLITAIVGLYFVIRLLFVQSIVALLFFASAINSLTFYTITWDNATLIPVLAGILKAETDVVASAGIVDRAYLRRVSRSIPGVGVRVGGFRNIERDSTLIFLDFVLYHVASLLISVQLGKL